MAAPSRTKKRSVAARKKSVLERKDMVRYIGTADIREIAQKDGWDNVGASDGKKVWHRANNWAIPVEEFSDEALVYLHEVDSEFVVEGVTVEPAEEEAAEA